MAEANKHAYSKMLRHKGEGGESEGEAQQAWSFVVGNKVLLNDLLVPCI